MRNCFMFAVTDSSNKEIKLSSVWCSSSSGWDNMYLEQSYW